MKTFGIVMLCLLGFLMLIGLGIGCNFFAIGMNHAYKSAEDAVVNYDNYQEMYNTCEKLNTDLGIILATPNEDKQFEQFSKSQRINSIKQNLKGGRRPKDRTSSPHSREWTGKWLSP